MRDYYFDEVQQWYVAFIKRERPRTRFIHWLVCDDFAHVIMVREAPGNATLLIDPEEWGCALQYVDKPVDEFLLEIAPRCSALVSYMADYRRCVQYRFRGIYTCVTLCKTILGIWGCWSIRPKGLYKFLLKRNTTTVVKAFIPYLPKEAIV